MTIQEGSSTTKALSFDGTNFAFLSFTMESYFNSLQ